MNTTEGVAIPCLWYFIPLLDPLPLPSGWQTGVASSPGDVLRAEGPVSGMDCSLQLHQVPRRSRPLAELLIDVTWAAALNVAKTRAAAARAEFSPPSRGDPPFDLDALNAALTVVEAAVPVPQHRAAMTIDDGLELALETIRHLQQSVAQLLQRPIRLVTRQTLPPLVPVYKGTLRLGALPDFAEPVEFMVTDHAPGVTFGLTEPALEPHDLARLERTLQTVAAGHPFNVYADVRREAMVQRTFYGNTRLTVLTLATAAEVLIDTLLLMLLWEQGEDSATAARLARERHTLRKRVSKLVGDRLRGDWRPRGEGPVAEYFTNLVSLRNSVVHAGLEPSAAQMVKAWDALFGLEKFIADRLSTNLFHYPRTAYLFAGEAGLRGRQQWSPSFESFVGDDSQPNWIRAFGRWRRAVHRHLDPHPAEPGSDPLSIDLIWELEADGTERWILHDRATGFATVANGLALTTTAQRAALSTVDAQREAASGPIRSLVAFDPAELPSDLDWRPEASLLPELRTDPGPPLAGSPS